MSFDYDYLVKKYNEDTFKVIYQKFGISSGFREEHFSCVDRSAKGNTSKLDNNYSRAKSRVFELALCNNWRYFFTGTLDKTKYDRFSLNVFHHDLTEFINHKKKTYGYKVDFVLIPEQHSDGSWHMHGLISNIPDKYLSDFDPKIHPLKLCNKGYKNWDSYSKKFGFCSLGEIRNLQATAFYIVKYITKSMAKTNIEVGGHLYYPSRGLKGCERVLEYTGKDDLLDSLLQTESEFAKVGWLFNPGDAWTSYLEDLTSDMKDLWGEPIVPPPIVTPPKETEQNGYFVYSSADQAVITDIAGVGHLRNDFDVPPKKKYRRKREAGV